METLCNHKSGSSLTLNTQSNEVEIRFSYSSRKFTRGFVLGWTTFKKPVEGESSVRASIENRFLKVLKAEKKFELFKRQKFTRLTTSNHWN